MVGQGFPFTSPPFRMSTLSFVGFVFLQPLVVTYPYQMDGWWLFLLLGSINYHPRHDIYGKMAGSWLVVLPGQ